MQISSGRGVTRAAALTALGSALAASALPARAQNAPIRIGAGLDDAYMEPFYAQDNGWFKKAGLDVEIMPLANGAAVAEAAAAGAIDVGLTDPVALATAVVRGVPFAYFAGGTVFSPATPTLVLCTNSSGPLKTAKDLEGKTIAVVSVHSFMYITTLEWLKQNGADPSNVKFFESHFEMMPAALARGTVDAALIGEPFLTGAGSDVRRIGVPFESCAKSFYIFGWFGRRDWITSHSDELRKLVGVLYDTARWANDHHAESAVIQAKYTKVDLARIQAMARNTLATNLDPALVQPVVDMATRYKLVSRPVSAANELIIPIQPG